MISNFEKAFPYPGYSWSMTQHVAPATNVLTMFELLKAASTFSASPKYQDDITNYMIERGLLTANVRSDLGKPQLWRDYQQILPELGLIVSTRFTNGVNVTPMGLMWLDGAIGYSELLTTQCLNYQYPNGHKQDLSPALRAELQGTSFSAFDNRTVLDAASGVMLKPAVLILRVLIELAKGSDLSGLSAPEIVVALMPTKRNNDWKTAITTLQGMRSGRQNPRDTRRIRHVQEWFRLLSLTDLFSLSTSGREQKIVLSDVAISNLAFVEQFCKQHEVESSFWIPNSEDPRQLGLSWFIHFGSPNIENQWAVEVSGLTSDYIQSNYPEGVFDEEDLEEKKLTDIEISLVEFSERKRLEVSEPDYKVDYAKIVEGRKKLREKTKLHDEIVSSLAKHLIQLDYQVWEDKSSVDLLASRNNQEAIFEVKTVNRNNFNRHIRLGVGQLLEYRFRREKQIETRPSALLVLSSGYSFPNWMIGYFEEDISLGLLSYHKDGFKNYTSGQVEKMMFAQ
jgi:hypothetical protein